MTPIAFHILHSVGLAVGLAATIAALVSVLGVIIRWWQCRDVDERHGWFRFGVMLTLMGLIAIGVAAASYSMEDACPIEEQRWRSP